MSLHSDSELKCFECGVKYDSLDELEQVTLGTDDIPAYGCPDCISPNPLTEKLENLFASETYGIIYIDTEDPSGFDLEGFIEDGWN